MTEDADAVLMISLYQKAAAWSIHHLSVISVLETTAEADNAGPDGRNRAAVFSG